MRLSFSESDIDPKTQLSHAAASIGDSKRGPADDWVDPDKTRVVPALELAARRTTAMTSSDPVEEEKKEPKTFLGLNLPQVVGGVLASTTAAILGAQLGLAGTIVGAAMTTGIITVGGAVYSSFINKTHSTFAARFRPKDPSKEPIDGQLEVLAKEPEEHGAGSWRDRVSPWKLLATAAAIFLLAAVVVTGLEALRGESFSGGGQTTVSQVSRDGLSNSNTSSESDTGDSTPQTEATQPAASPEPTVQETEQPAPNPEPEPTTEPTPAPVTTEPTTGSAGDATGDSGSEDTTADDSTATGTSGSSSNDDSTATDSDGTGGPTGAGTGTGTTEPDSSSTGGSGSNATNSLTENRTVVEEAPTAE